MRQSKLRKNYELLFTGLVFCVFLFPACTKEKRETIVTGSSSGPATLSSIQQDVFRLSCGTSGCHDNRATPAGNLDLTSTGRSYSHLVNRDSIQVANLKLVNPGDPDTSYLMDKLRGTHIAVGGLGVRMPQYAAAISETDITRIQDWIIAGALNN